MSTPSIKPCPGCSKYWYDDSGRLQCDYDCDPTKVVKDSLTTELSGSSGELVARLRGVDISWSQVGEDCAAAADEIKRLLVQVAALREALKELSTDWDCCSVSRSMREVARAALEEK